MFKTEDGDREGYFEVIARGIAEALYMTKD